MSFLTFNSRRVVTEKLGLVRAGLAHYGPDNEGSTALLERVASKYMTWGCPWALEKKSQLTSHYG